MSAPTGAAADRWKFGGRGTSQWGLMVGSIFQLVLRDLRREGFTTLAEQLLQVLQKRMAKWLSMEFPCNGGASPTPD